MKVEWWYDASFFKYPDDVEVALARLTVRDDGSAEILTDGQETLEFENEEDASLWFGDEEYRRVWCLVDDLEEDHHPVDPRLRALLGEGAKSYSGPMLFDLDLRLTAADGEAQRDRPDITTPVQTDQ